MIRFALGVLCGVILMSQMTEIRDSGTRPWENRIDKGRGAIQIVLANVKG